MKTRVLRVEAEPAVFAPLFEALAESGLRCGWLDLSGPVTGSPLSSRSGCPSSSKWGTPALRKYFETMMSVATCDQPDGISTSVISKTIEPSGLVIRESRPANSIPA